MEVKISEQIEKLVHIIMQDLLNYLEMAENEEPIEKRIEKNISLTQNEKNKNLILF